MFIVKSDIVWLIVSAGSIVYCASEIIRAQDLLITAIFAAISIPFCIILRETVNDMASRTCVVNYSSAYRRHYGR